VTAAVLAQAPLDAETLLALGRNLLPGLALAAVVLLLVGAGLALGRRVPRRSILRLESSLRRLLVGDYQSPPDLSSRDPAAGVGELIGELGRAMEERTRRLEHRAVVIGQAFEQVADRGILIVDRGMTIVTAGEGVARMAGRPAGDLERQPASSLFTEKSWKDFVVRLLDADRRFLGVTGTLEIVREGQERPLEVRVVAADTELPKDGIALLLESVPEDGGDEGVLHARELGALLDGLSDGLLVVSSGLVRSANPTARRWIGEDVVGEPLKDLIAAEDLLFVLDRVSRTEGGERVSSFRCRLLPMRPELRPRDVAVHPVPVQMDDRREAILTMRDLGGSGGLRRQVQLQRAKLRSVVDAAADGIILLEAPDREDGEWRLSVVNERARQLLELPKSVTEGSREDTLRGAIAHRFRDPVGLLGFFDHSKDESDEEWTEAFELNDAQASSLELVARPVAGADGVRIGRVVVIRDISRHKEVERQLRDDADAVERSRESLQRAFEELSALNKSMEKKASQLDSVNQELRELDVSRAQLISSMTHELQAPLVAIRGYTQMVLEGRLGRINDEQRRGLDRVLGNVDRMVELIGNLLAMAKAEASPELKPEPVPAERVIREVVERHRSAADEKRVKLEVEISRPDLRLIAEREGLTQVLENLVGNAVKFNRESGRVRVVVTPAPEGFVTLSVTDTGVGIPSDEQKKVFDRFFRGTNAAGVPGSGIGLATVRAIVERHGGTIACDSTYGRGTTFRVVWPREVSSGSTATG